MPSEDDWIEAELTGESVVAKKKFRPVSPAARPGLAECLALLGRRN